MKHLLVTNDFPPKIGGIQSYLWELWRRLPPEDVTVLTTPYANDKDFDESQAFKVVRTKQWWLLPTPSLIRQINALAEEVEAELIVLDPALPLGLVGPHLKLPYVILGHGAEIAIPAKLPVAAVGLHRVLRSSAGLIASGAYVAGLGKSWSSLRGRPSVSIPPGVDTARFQPLNTDQKQVARVKFGLSATGPLIVGVSRLVPRKGFDRLIKAAAILAEEFPEATVAIAGSGREERRLKKLARKLQAPVVFLGRVPDEDLAELYGSGDVFAMACHDRWFGLEREGFGIVFVEAAAAGVPCVAGKSGGSAEAVISGETGVVVAGRVSANATASAIATILRDPALASQYGKAGRSRMEREFSYDVLADRLAQTLRAMVSRE